jgi:hypothetical protein
VFNTHDSNNLISKLQIFKSDSGWIHAIWNEANPTGQGRGIYYSRGRIDTSEWSDPEKLADAESGLGTNTPAIIEYHSIVSAFYNLGGIICQRSNDAEKGWTSPKRVFSRHVGVNGALSLVVDSNDELHMFFGQRITGSPDIHGMWHSVFDGVNWSEPDAVVAGPQITDQARDKTFDPYEARAVVSQGNFILVTWRTDPGFEGGNGVWYSDKTLEAPELPIVILETVLPAVKTNPYQNHTSSNLQLTSIPSSIPTEGSPGELISPSLNDNTTSALQIAIIPALLLIALIIILKLITNHVHK